MSALSSQPIRIPLGTTSDGKLVFISREWWNFISVELFARAGAALGASTTDLETSQFEDAGISEMLALVYANEQGQNQRPRDEFVITDAIDNTSELRARIDAIETELQALRQGFQL